MGNNLTEEDYLALIEEEGDAVEEVPDALRTPEFFLSAVKRNGFALEYVPENLKTSEMRKIAAEQKKRADIKDGE